MDMTVLGEVELITRISVSDLHRQVSEILDRVRNTGERFIIERRGVPVATIVSIQDLERLDLQDTNQRPAKEQRLAALAQAKELRQQVLVRRGGIPLPDSAAFLNELREERDQELFGLN